MVLERIQGRRWPGVLWSLFPDEETEDEDGQQSVEGQTRAQPPAAQASAFSTTPTRSFPRPTAPWSLESPLAQGLEHRVVQSRRFPATFPSQTLPRGSLNTLWKEAQQRRSSAQISVPLKP